MNYPALQDRLYDGLARSATARRAAWWLRNVATQVLAHRLAPSIDLDRNGEALLQRELAPTLRIVIDVGANRGDWTARLLSAAPTVQRVVCYEPGRSALAMLRGRFALEGRVEIVDAAVADTVGEQRFFEEPHGGETSSLVGSHTSELASVRRVRTVILDDELDRLGIERVDLLKIDAEGMDLHVLRGAQCALRDQRIATIQFEYGGAWAAAGSTLIAAFDLLVGHGYEVFALLSDGLHPYDAGGAGELFVYSNFVACLKDGFARLPCRRGSLAL